MNITLYRYLGERNKVDKSGDLVYVLSTTGQFKADTAVLSPSLILSLPSGQISAVTDEDSNVIDNIIVQASNENEVIDFNYFYIAEFRRYYYLTSIIVSSNNILVISGEADPLYSFKDEILNNEAMIERNEFEYDISLTDNLIPFTQKKNITIEDITGGGLVNTYFETTYVTKNFMFTTLENDEDDSSYEDIDLRNINGLSGYIDTTSFGEISKNVVTYCAYKEEITILLKDILAHEDRASYLFSVVEFPFQWEFDDSLSAKEVELGRFYVSDLSLEDEHLRCRPHKYRGMLPPKIIADKTFPDEEEFYKFSPYRTLDFYIPFVGVVSVDYHKIAGKHVIVYYALSCYTGEGNAYIYNVTDGVVIHSSSVAVGKRLSINRNNFDELARTAATTAISTSLGVIAGIAAIALSGGAALGVATGVMGIGSSLGSAAATSIKAVEKGNVTIPDLMTGLLSPLKVQLIYTDTEMTLESVEDWEAFAHQYGRPLNNVRRLSTLRGYTKVAQLHLEGLSATDMEKREIESSLLSGVIL